MKKIIVLSCLLFSLAALASDPYPCQAKTKAGTACKLAALPTTHFCHVHDPGALRCGAPTKAGKPCMIRTKGTRCKKHSL